MRLALLALALPAPALALAQGPAAVSTPIEWEELGPAPITSGPYTGRVSAVACSRVDPDLYFVGGADGGVWRTRDGGASWTPLTDDRATLSVGAIALAPSDEDVVYVGTGEANYANHSRYGLGLLKSTDGGDTWQRLAEATFAGRTFSRLVVHPTRPDHLWAAVARAGGFPELAAAKGHPGRDGDVGVFESVDGGATWTRLAGLPAVEASDLALDPVDPDVMVAAIGRIFGDPANGVYRSTDGGATWARLGGGLPGGTLGRISVAVAPSDRDRLYALVTNPASATGSGASVRGAYRSTDGGATWQDLGVSGNLQASYGWYLSVVGVKPTDADRAFFGGLSLRRTDGPFVWSNVTPPHVDLHAIEWDAAGRLVVGDDGGVHRSTNDGGSWTPLNQGLGLVQCYAGLSTHPTQPETFFAGFQDNGSARRAGPGTGWTQVFGGDGGWTQVDRASGSTVFVEYQGSGNLFRSTNGGASFSSSSFGISGGDRNAFLPPYLIRADDPSRMLYATHRIYRSTNGGSSWTPISGALDGGSGAVRALAWSPSDALVVYAATNDGRVLRSDDGGSTWTVLLTAHPGWPRVTSELFVHPRRPMTVWLATASFGVDQVRRSTDGGATWTSLDGDLPDLPVNCVAALPRRGGPETLFAGTDAGVHASFDGGTHWSRYGRGLPNAVVVDLRLEPARGRVVVATQGRGAWRAPLLGTVRPR